jgi:arylsulfatase A-like enzyme
MAARYDSGVLAADTYVGMLIDELKSSGRWEQTLLVIVSDHGEDLQTHGFSNHRAVVFDSTTRVPFILSGGALPEALRGQQSSLLVDAVDLLPTVAEAVGISPPIGVGGRSLWPLARGEDPDPKPYVFQQGVTGQTSMRSATHRLVFEGGRLAASDYLKRLRTDGLLMGSFSLYHSEADPWEIHNIIHDEISLAHEMREQIVHWAESLQSSSAQHTPSQEAFQSMEKQGYWSSDED